MRTDRQKLEGLRVALGRVAQAANVQIEDKPVLDKSCNELREMAKEDSGWHTLASLVCDEVGWIKHELGRYQRECDG